MTLEGTRVVLVCPNDLVVDTRGQKMAQSLHRMGMDVTVVARASERAADRETVDGVEIVRLALPAVARVHPPPPPPSKKLVREAEELDAQAARMARLAREDGRPLRARVVLRGRGLALKARRRLKGIETRRQRRREKGVVRPIDQLPYRAPWPGWRETMWFPLEMDKVFWPVIESLDPDVIHCHDLDGLVASGLAHERLLAQGKDVRLVYDAHENWAGLPDIDWTQDIHASWLGVEAEFAPQSDLVITVSEEIADAIQQRWSLPDRPLVVLNTPSTRMAEPAERTLREAAGLDASTPVMVYSGSISHARRVPDLVRALPLMPDVHLVIVSVPYPHRFAPEFEELADSLGVRDRLHIVPPVTSSQVVSYLSTANVGVHPLLPGAPNHEMALPNKLFEYLHAGIPVVVSNCRAMTAFVRENNLGREFEHGSIDSLAKAVLEVLDGRREGGFTPPAGLAEAYSWEAREPALAQAYAAMLAAEPIGARSPR